MPLYEYRCEVCGEPEEMIQSYTAPTEHDCIKCGAKEGMKRQISQVAFNLSGGGWYAHGYGKDSAAPKDAPAVSKESSPASGGCNGCACKPGA